MVSRAAWWWHGGGQGAAYEGRHVRGGACVASQQSVHRFPDGVASWTWVVGARGGVRDKPGERSSQNSTARTQADTARPSHLPARPPAHLRPAALAHAHVNTARTHVTHAPTDTQMNPLPAHCCSSVSRASPHTPHSRPPPSLIPARPLTCALLLQHVQSLLLGHVLSGRARCHAAVRAVRGPGRETR